MKIYKRFDEYVVFRDDVIGVSFAIESAEAEVESYLAEHPEALVDEPVPPEPTSEQKAAAIRAQRNALLSSCDWTMLADTAVDKDAWGDYRQALRDVTDQATFPDSVEWPVKPE